MKQFAGIDIEKIDVKSAENLNAVSHVFLNNYQDNYFMPHNCVDDQSVINPLRIFIKWHLIPFRTLDQAMAIIIKHLPDDQNDCGNIEDNLILSTLKFNLRELGYGGIDGYAFRTLDFNQRCEMVVKLRCHIGCHKDKDWSKLVCNTHDALNRKLFAIATESLLGIVAINDQRNKSIHKNDLPAIIALQISYYSNVLGYLRDKLYSDPIIDFYNKVEMQLMYSINKLKSLPESNSVDNTSGWLTNMFFCYKHAYQNKRYARIAPELKQPWLDSRARRFRCL